MFELTALEKVNNIISFAGKDSDSSIFDSIAKLQSSGVASLCKILSTKQFAYLADEVGMGKTYQAIGVIAMLLDENPDAKILIIAPNEAIQDNWLKEVKAFCASNLKKIKINAADEAVLKKIHPIDLIREHKNSNKTSSINVIRLTSFSSIGARISGCSGSDISSNKLCNGLKKITNCSDIIFECSKSISSYDAGIISANVLKKHSPDFDLVIIDEAQNIRNKNNATAFLDNWLGLKRGIKNDELEKEFHLDYSCDKIKSKFLLLSATPAHRNIDSLRHQIEYFEIPPKELTREYLQGFMIRRLRTYADNKSEPVRSYKAQDVSDELTVEKKLFLALIQSRLAQEQKKNNATFKIGFLETFESYNASSLNNDENKQDEEEIHYGKEFENGGSNEIGEKGCAADKNFLFDISKSYFENFPKSPYPPHPKFDYMENEVKALYNKNISDFDECEFPEKSIIFVRRLASVGELVHGRLTKLYENAIIEQWASILDTDSSLESIQSEFEKLYPKQNSAGSFDDENNNEETITFFDDDAEGDEDSKSELKKWLALKRFDKGEKYSAVSRFKKTLLANHSNSSIFEENYLRTYTKKSNKSYEKYVNKLIDADFVRLVNEYVSAQPSRYIYKSEKNPLKKSALLPLCCFVALKKENNNHANELEKYFDIKPKVDMTKEYISSEKIKEILLQTSFWNYYKTDENYMKLDFFKREALKRMAEKHLKASEAILEILYCFITDKNHFCQNVYKQFSSDKNHHAKRIKQLFANGELVFNQVVGLEELDYTYDPKFLNNQSWIIGVMGSSKNKLPLINRFNTPFYPDVIVCTDVLKEGINLHLFCNRVYHYGLAWTPGDLEQRVGRVDRFFSKTHRARRIGESTKINITYPYMGKSIDEQQLKKVLCFKNSADPLLDTASSSAKSIDLDLISSTTVDELIANSNSIERCDEPYSAEKILKNQA